MEGIAERLRAAVVMALVGLGSMAPGVAQADEGVAPVTTPPAYSPPSPWSGELRMHVDPVADNHAGPIAAANRLEPGLVAPQRDAAVIEAGLRGHEHGVSVDLLLREQLLAGGAVDDDSRIDELYFSDAVPGGGDAWAYSVGQKIVGWDVGYAWRPNDVVEQEPRQLLLATTPEGRPLLQLEHFSAETAWSGVWVNPQHFHTGLSRSAGAEESALAMRVYQRDGAVDWHGFARWGEHTHASLGAALAWVATESIELHASLRYATAHDGWVDKSASSGALARSDPWQIETQGAAPQALVGFTWTNAEQLTVIGEAYHDGSAPSDAQWAAWGQRDKALSAAGPAPASAYAGNLAWQTDPWNSQNLRQDNLFLRIAWQPDHWQPALDLLYTPADGGRMLTASLAWQGDRWRLEGGWRSYGGPSGAVLASLPQRGIGYLSATRAF